MSKPDRTDTAARAALRRVAADLERIERLERQLGEARADLAESQRLVEEVCQP